MDSRTVMLPGSARRPRPSSEVESPPRGPIMDSQRDPTITDFLNDFRGGSPSAFDELWNRYFARLVEEARGRLRGGQRLDGSDEEDVVLSALNSFHRRARRGDFPRLEDRDD